MKNKSGNNIYYHFTDRQIEYLALTSMGFVNKKIASILCTEETTVKKILEELFVKLNAVDRTSMVDNARVYGILTDKTKYKVANKYNINLPITKEERYISKNYISKNNISKNNV